jgi:GNAT superfamily N-acetyltransferase/DNA-binding MarR family transcriptional regulator
MQPTLAQTELPPPGVHAIIEIGTHESITVIQLGKVLLLEEPVTARLVRRLIESKLVQQTTASNGASLSLTPEGKNLLGKIDRFADLRVGKALHSLSGSARHRVVGGLAEYADALRAGTESSEEVVAPADIEIHEGFLPGAIGRVAEMHGRYYAREWAMPSFFEARVASGIAEFSQRLDRPANQLWLAVQAGQIVGSAAIDGEDLGEGKAHLRWVILDDGLRGSGTGRRLLNTAMAFCDARGYPETHLWTFKGLNAARRLYESLGFVLAEEWSGDQWGKPMTEQRFVRKKPL